MPQLQRRFSLIDCEVGMDDYAKSFLLWIQVVIHIRISISALVQLLSVNKWSLRCIHHSSDAYDLKDQDTFKAKCKMRRFRIP